MKLLRNSLCAIVLLTVLAIGPTRAQRLLLTPTAGPVSLQRGIRRDVLSANAATTGEVVVRFRDGVSGEHQGQLIGSTGSVISRADPASGYALVRVRESRAGDLVRALGNSPEVLHAEPSY